MAQSRDPRRRVPSWYGTGQGVSGEQVAQVVGGIVLFGGAALLLAIAWPTQLESGILGLTSKRAH